MTEFFFSNNKPDKIKNDLIITFSSINKYKFPNPNHKVWWKIVQIVYLQTLFLNKKLLAKFTS